MSEQVQIGDTFTTSSMAFPRSAEEAAKDIYPKSYRIEVMRTNHGWMQRHIWTYDDGTVRADKWIPSSDHDKPGRLDGYTKIAAQDEAA